MAPTLTDFLGEWRIARRIVHIAGGGARFSGRATFAPAGTGLICFETGEMRLTGQVPIRAERRSLWRPGPGGAIEVRFADGRAFHHFDPAEAVPRARHDCAPDVYEVAYDFTRWPAWSARWRVRGPRKDYALVSRYQPERRHNGAGQHFFRDVSFLPCY